MIKNKGTEHNTLSASRLGFSPIGGACIFSSEDQTGYGTLRNRPKMSDAHDTCESECAPSADSEANPTRHAGDTDRRRLSRAWIREICSEALTLTIFHHARFITGHLQKNR